MKRFISIIAILPVLLALLLAGCTVDDPDHPTGLTAAAGHKYMSLGNSLTAGFMDGGLIVDGQGGSYPRLIATKMGIDTTVGTGNFNQPWIAYPGVGTKGLEDPNYAAGVLYFDGLKIAVLDSILKVEVPSVLSAATLPTPYHNLGVPGALLTDVMGAYSAATSYGATVGQPNSYFDFINRASFFGNLTGDPATEDPTEQPSMFRAAVAKGAEIATLWIGNNDILGGAMAGTPIVGVTVTDPADFGLQYNTLLQSLAGGLVLRNGFPSTIVVANIPSITDIPYFIPKASFELAIGGAQWPWGYEEGTNDAGMLMTLPALSWVAVPANQGSALPAKYTLTSAEVATVAGVVNAYNDIIVNAVATINTMYPGTCAMFDANGMMADLPAAQKTHFLFVLDQVGGDIPTAAATTYFSLDGVHPNHMGYAMIANGFLTEINTLTGSDYGMYTPSDMTWDPTYSRYSPEEDTKSADGRLFSDAATRSLENMFQ